VKLGIDVGGTNTDAVLMDSRQVVGWFKTATTPDVTTGIINSLQALLAGSRVLRSQIDAVMIGTTHFTNAVVERRHLQQTACIRLGLPATASLPPMVDWPDDLRQVVGGRCWLAHGGHEFDGRIISPLDEGEIRSIVAQIKELGIRAVAISSVFSPVDDSFETQTAAVVRRLMPDAQITLSSEIGRIGLLERENAAVMNACLRDLALKTVGGFKSALRDMQIEAPLFISQNDGTLMNAAFAEAYPVLTFASGPTNSMRGAAFLTGLQDAIVIDVGGTTTDVGMLQHGFPRPAGLAVEVGGVRTNFRMPDTYSFGLGGGSLVQTDPIKVGPKSVGYRITREALVFGGAALTATDIVAAAGKCQVGQTARVSHLDPELVAAVEDYMLAQVTQAVDRVKVSAAPVPVILVGGGSILIQKSIPGTSEQVKPEFYPVANAIGAAIAQVGGECDRVFSLAEMSREEALASAKKQAAASAITAGAEADSIEIVDVEEVPLAYLPGNATRIMVKAVGDLKEK